MAAIRGARSEVLRRGVRGGECHPTSQLPPDDGTIQRAEWLQVVYFDQNRESVDPESATPTRAPLKAHLWMGSSWAC